MNGGRQGRIRQTGQGSGWNWTSVSGGETDWYGSRSETTFPLACSESERHKLRCSGPSFSSCSLGHLPPQRIIILHRKGRSLPPSPQPKLQHLGSLSLPPHLYMLYRLWACSPSIFNLVLKLSPSLIFQIWGKHYLMGLHVPPAYLLYLTIPVLTTQMKPHCYLCTALPLGEWIIIILILNQKFNAYLPISWSFPSIALNKFPG